MPTRKWGSEKLVNTTTAGNQLNSDVAALAGGGFVVVWQDDSGADAAIRAQRYDALGNRVGGEMTITAGPGAETLPSVTGLADGGFYVTWTLDTGPNSNDIRGNVYNANGAFVRSQPVIFASGNDTDSDVARLGTDSVVVWEDATNTNIAFRIFSDAGIGGGVLTANTTESGLQENPSVAATPDGLGFIVVWTSGLQSVLMGRLFSADGTGSSELSIAGGPLRQPVNPVVAWLDNDQFAVAWQNFTSGQNYHIEVQIFTPIAGTITSLTEIIPVNSTMTNDQTEPQITVLPNGGFVVSWIDESTVGGDNSGAAIRLQAFDGGGGKIGGEFLVNTTTNLDQIDSSISALADGRIAVSWTDQSSGTADIQMQIVDPRDGIVTGTGGSDNLYGHDAVGDEISGFAGADTMHGLAGNDQLYGGAGADYAYAGKGDDTLFGGADADILVGDLGDDDLFGEEGNDDLRGSAGADLLDGGAGNDVANYSGALAGVTAALDGSLAGTGDAAGDTFNLVEFLKGSNSAASGDNLRGDGNANIIYGFAGNDSLYGQGGADTLRGDAGADKLFGGAGTDTLTGGLGNDQFFYNAIAETPDTITDFSSNAAGNNDLFQFKGSVFGGLPAGAIAANQFETNTSGLATTATARFIYETDARILHFDSNGSAVGGTILGIATLQAGATMAFGDISIF